MFRVKNCAKTYFANNGLTKVRDFQWTKPNDRTIHYISKEKALLIYPEHTCTGYNNGIRLKELYNQILLLKGFEYILAQHICGLVTLVRHDMCDVCTGTVINIRPQVLFTYSLKTYIDKCRSNLSFVIEEDFLSKTRFANISVGVTRGPKIDILMDMIKIVIEFDERHHNSYEHTCVDVERDGLINALGYKVLRVSINDDINHFITNILDPIIDERLFLFDPSKLPEYIIKLFCKMGHDEDHVKLLVHSECIDIINHVEPDMIGMTPDNIVVLDIMNYLNLNSSDDDSKEIIKDIIDDMDESKFPYINAEDVTDIILSPKAMENVLSMISHTEIRGILEFRTLYTEIKSTFLRHTHDTAYKLNELRINTERAMGNIITNAYNRARKDIFIEMRNEKKNEKKHQRELMIYKKHFEKMLPKNGAGIIRELLPSVSIELQDGKAFIAEIPQLVYSENETDYIDLDDIKIYRDINIRIFRFSGRSCNQIISMIRTKLNKPKSAFNNTTLMHNCKFLI